MPPARRFRLKAPRFFKGFEACPAGDIMQRIVQADNPRQAVRALSAEDFYWVAKKVGEQDALILLELASDRQWQYVLDLELWDGDRLDLEESGAWLGRLEQADCRRLALWFFSEEGSPLIYYHLFRNVDIVVIEDEEELWNLPDGHFSVDGIYFVRAADPGAAAPSGAHPAGHGGRRL